MLSRNLDECIASREVVLVVEVSDGLGRYARKRGAAAALKKIHYHEQHDVGLKNLGNTCYMNAVLQALVHVRAWREYFSSREYEFDVNREARFGAKGKLAVAFGKLVEELDVDFSRHENGASVGHDCVRAGVVEPRRFKRIVGAFAKRFQGQDQQDAAEFLAKLLEGFGEELNRVKGDKPYVEDKDDDDDERCAAAAWANHLRREDHAVTACFAGLVRNELVCAATKERKTAFEPFCSLVVPLPERRGAFVRDCLAAVARAETVTAHSRAATAKNGGTYTETQFVRSVHVWAAPPILVLTLRRFKVIAATGARYKLTNLVSFPLEGLVLPAALLACGSATYDVTAVINHTGSLQGGHYTCAARSLQAGKDEWLLFNDAAVTVVQDPGTTVVTAAAYVLFLTR
ncbi:hypothetical protein M885DRAFT_446280, partial [Pelagophyceae sp. CCMP2097]